MCDPQPDMIRTLILLSATASLLAACAGNDHFPGAFNASAPAPAAPAAALASPGLAAVASAAPGARARIDDPALGGAVDLDVLQAYSAASGRACKRVAIRPAAGGRILSRVACAGPQGWYWTAASIT